MSLNLLKANPKPINPPKYGTNLNFLSSGPPIPFRAPFNTASMLPPAAFKPDNTLPPTLPAPPNPPRKLVTNLFPLKKSPIARNTRIGADLMFSTNVLSLKKSPIALNNLVGADLISLNALSNEFSIFPNLGITFNIVRPIGSRASNAAAVAAIIELPKSIFDSRLLESFEPSLD